MVNEKQAAARTSILCVLVRKYFANVVKSPGLVASCLFPALFLLVCRFIIFDYFGSEDTLVFLLAFGMMFSTGMVPGTTIVYPMAEAREKHTLRTLELAGVGRNQTIAAHGIVGALSTALVGAACFLVSGASLDCMLPFALITVLAGIPLVALSLALGLASRNQMAANLSGLPIILIGIAPLFFMIAENSISYLPLLPTGGGLALVHALAEGTLLTSASIVPALAQLAWIIASLVAFVVVAPHIPRDE